ncbi:hypothetical protein GCM10007067_12830 [Lysobacter bugurensis]|uniref:Uncharacterized protein n=2 Tax=Cognatilysobacter bugurensis TaxID=543356 RepID=A0A918SX75_9GAMM|nr:hypothetical protein GCM10007067_12830 [Lysobacter bugurensis]
MKAKRFGRMSPQEEQAIINELGKWQRGELGSSLTWAKLETRFGFSRQTLHTRKSITDAFALAKAALAGGLSKGKTDAEQQIAAMAAKITVLENKLAASEERERKWMVRWQQIAFHVRQRGMHTRDVDRTATSAVPDKREAAAVLRPFDRPIPSAQ